MQFVEENPVNLFMINKTVFTFQSFSSHLPWAECPREYFQNESYTINEECEVMVAHVLSPALSLLPLSV